MEFSRQEDLLWSEESDISRDILESLYNVINSKWDAPTLQRQIEELMQQYLKVHDELDNLEDPVPTYHSFSEKEFWESI